MNLVDILEFAHQLIKEGEEVHGAARQVKINSFQQDWLVPTQQFEKWRTSCRLLMTQLGNFGDPWRGVFDAEITRRNRFLVEKMLGSLKSIAENVAAGRLTKVEDMVLAEAFANLQEQGEYLLDSGYFLAAGVLFRAVLEEKLRRLCEANNCVPQKAKATLNDYNQSLYKGNVYNKITFKGVDDMAGIGNDAAHNANSLTKADVERLRTNLSDFLSRHS